MLSYKRFLNNEFLNGTDPCFLNKFYQADEIFWTSSGRGSFDLVLKNLKLGRKDYVLVPSFIAHGIILPLKKNKIPYVLYNCDRNLGPDIKDILNKLTSLNIKLIVVVHYFGFPQRVSELFSILRSKNVIILEDCAQAFLSIDDDGIPLGKKGDIAIFSLPKFLPVPDGSFIIYNNLKLKPLSISYHYSILHFFSVRIHLLYLKLKKIQAKLGTSAAYYLIDLFAKSLYYLYYKSICLQQNPVNTSKYTKRFIEIFDFNKFRLMRQQNSKKIYNSLNKLHGGNLLFNNYGDYCTTGIPLIIKNRNSVISDFRRENIEVLTYVKYWNYIPEIEKDNYLIETEFQKSHLLLPASENLNPKQIEHIISVTIKILT